MDEIYRIDTENYDDDRLVQLILDTDFDIPVDSELDTDEEDDIGIGLHATDGRQVISLSKLSELGIPEKSSVSCEPTTSKVVSDEQPGPSASSSVVSDEQPGPPAVVSSNTGKSSKNKSGPPKVLWKCKEFQAPKDIQFLGNTDLPPEIAELQTPTQFFSYFITDEFLESIVSETIKYSVQKD